LMRFRGDNSLKDATIRVCPKRPDTKSLKA
jgi:hypothetical protein